jgi:hypothetical protein
MECYLDKLHLAVEKFDPRDLACQAGADNKKFVMQKIHAHQKVGAGIHYLIKWGGFQDKSLYTWKLAETLIPNVFEIMFCYNLIFGLSA